MQSKKNKQRRFYPSKISIVSKLRLVFKKLENKNGKFALIMLIPTEPTLIDSKFTLIISATWLDNENQKKGIEIITSYLKRVLDDIEFSYITRVTIVHSTDKSVRTINSVFYVENGFERLTNINIFGVTIDKAILLESNYNNRECILDKVINL